jgi:hypothetical protein
MRGLTRWHRGATFAALFALLLQAALSFGHIHAGPAERHTASAAVASGPSDRFCALPDEDRDGDHADGHCVICATLKLLGHGWMASPPAFPVRRGSQAASSPCRTAATPAQGRAAAFRSRAPPLA